VRCWRCRHLALNACALQALTSLRGCCHPRTRSTAGIALACLGALAGMCVAADDAPASVVATLAAYNVGAAANNAGQRGGALPTAVHALLAAALLRYALADFA
jgi:hypothetical protein